MDDHSRTILKDRPECRASTSEITSIAKRIPHGRRQLSPCHRVLIFGVIVLIVVGLAAWSFFGKKAFTVDGNERQESQASPDNQPKKENGRTH